MNILGFFQRLGRALQLPIAVLPVAALLLRFGQPDLLNVAFIAQAGGAIFDNLALIFAIGVASSWSKDSAGAAALAGRLLCVNQSDGDHQPRNKHGCTGGYHYRSGWWRSL